jgi:hypothetical protein
LRRPAARPRTPGSPARTVDLLVRLEWAVAAAVAIGFYAAGDGSWLLFALLILAPDLAMLGYLAGPRAGAAAYNAAHVLIWPALLLAAGVLVEEWPLAVEVALIWIAHIAVDRAMGYGLKLPTGFRDTHMGRIGHD